ncbi:ATP-binding protein [Tenacibaculum finnmarkense]|nr:ATP-binding protein [Tenacibaculum finnmarkense]MCG8206867.1 ATP-binding protein [Tenacibaculum finnmarkense genomovar finnmarkense]MCG8741223.1 ATP-binding protein [Tenacibaculum finnmarkense]MCG8777519.1 ATP-binding protein [Tenacibaculum finnmarkense]
MIVRFIISNFKSVKDPVEFSFIAGNYKKHKDHLEKLDDFELLKISALYGNNGSGKTNIFLALRYLKEFVIYGGNQDFLNKIPYFKLDKDYNKKPTKFEIEFIINDSHYSYSVSVFDGKIIEEWLYKMKGENNYDVIFERNLKKGKSVIKIGNQKKLSKKEFYRREIYAEELLDYELFFTIGYIKTIPEFDEPFTWFMEKLNIMGLNESLSGLPSLLSKDSKFSDLAQAMICNSDLGIKKIDVLKTPIEDFFGPSDKVRRNDIINEIEEYGEVDFIANGEDYSAYKDDEENVIVAKIITYRLSATKELVEFHLNEESAGTRRLFNLIPVIINSIINNEVYLIDEIESSFHPILIKSIIELYLKLSKGKKSQIICSTHESNLLDLNLFRQDEIWFAEKDSDGSTRLTSLSDFKPRFDKDIRKGYLQGQYSEIPFTANLADLNWNDNA